LGYRDAQGRSPWEIGDKALLRAIQYQWYLQQKFGGKWYSPTYHSDLQHLAFLHYGFKPVDYDAVGGSKNLCFEQWSHQKQDKP
jgi:hypothetical protein